MIGDKMKYLFVPLGFGNWQSAVAVITSIFAKEAVIQTLTVVSETPASLFVSPYSAYAFMAFILLMPPCVAALSAAWNELKSAKTFALMIVFQTVTAYLVALAVNCIGLLSGRGITVFISLTIVAFGFIISLRILKKKRVCRGCGACGSKKCRNKKANTTI